MHGAFHVWSILVSCDLCHLCRSTRHVSISVVLCGRFWRLRTKTIAVIVHFPAAGAGTGRRILLPSTRTKDQACANL